MDFLLSLTGIIVLSPIILIISVLIKMTSKGPILFMQTRVGKDNSKFRIFKFRTMRIDTPNDCPTHLLKNPEQYITGIGKFLRKSSLDELPQLFNILIGNMSIIGPRPSLSNQFDLNHLRNENGASKIKPGLTGLAQISGRDELDIVIKAKFDGYYSNNINIITDIKILVRTFLSILKSEGIQEGKQNE